MIPEHIQRQVVSYANFIRKSRPFANDLIRVGYNDFDKLAGLLLHDETFSLTLCTYCQHAELYFDFLHPSDTKTLWTVVIKTSIRCTKLMEKFTIHHLYFEDLKDEDLTIPGQLTFRSYCPRFEVYKDEEKEAKTDD